MPEAEYAGWEVNMHLLLKMLRQEICSFLSRLQLQKTVTVIPGVLKPETSCLYPLGGTAGGWQGCDWNGRAAGGAQGLFDRGSHRGGEGREG